MEVHHRGWALSLKPQPLAIYSLCFMLVCEAMNAQPAASAPMPAVCNHASMPRWAFFLLRTVIQNKSFLKLPWLWCFITATARGTCLVNSSIWWHGDQSSNCSEFFQAPLFTSLSIPLVFRTKVPSLFRLLSPLLITPHLITPTSLPLISSLPSYHPPLQQPPIMFP